VQSWEDCFDLLSQIDTCVLGGGMYPGYEQYWLSVLADPSTVLPFSGKHPTDGEIAYARFADRTPHIVLSKTIDNVAWSATRVVHDLENIRKLKQQSGKDIHAVGGAKLVASLLNAGLIDEFRLVVHPIVLAGGKALFKAVSDRHVLQLLHAEPMKSGQVRLTYRTQFAAP
jgi:dihydrofolate reductase